MRHYSRRTRKPRRRSKRRLQKGGSESSAVCAIMIEEDKYVDEWIQYYFYGLGFTKVFIYDNSPGNTLKELPNKYPNVTVVHFPGRVKQLAAYQDWFENNGKSITWCAFLDADEFIVLKKHSNITEFLREYCEEGGLAINWYRYGDSHLKEYTDEPVTKRFTWRENKVNQHIKTIIKCSDVEAINNIHAVHKYKSGKMLKDTEGHTVTGLFNPDGPVDTAVIHHYFTKTLPEFEMKRRRGKADATNIREKSEYDAHNFNEVEDDSAYKIYLKAREKMKNTR
jgi:hypothetical protein